MQLERMINKQIIQDLEEVKMKMDQQLQLGDSYLKDSLDYAKAEKGKMLRSLLLLIGSYFSRNIKKERETFVELAAVIETLHLATLIHDDIVDEAKMRRGQESIQSKYSKSYAVFMGDFLLSQSFLMLAGLDIKKDVGLRLAKTVSQICIGEMNQHKWRYNTSIMPLDYLRIISGKTAALFAVSMSSGALHGKVKEGTVKLLARIGYQIGMAFQVIDDLLDYLGDDELVGKELRSDLIQGYYSLPVIYALTSEYGEIIKEQLENGLTNKKSSDELIELIKKSGAIDKTKALAIRYNERALSLVEKLPQGDGKKTLKMLIPELLQRAY